MSPKAGQPHRAEWWWDARGLYSTSTLGWLCLHCRGVSTSPGAQFGQGLVSLSRLGQACQSCWALLMDGSLRLLTLEFIRFTSHVSIHILPSNQAEQVFNSCDALVGNQLLAPTLRVCFFGVPLCQVLGTRMGLCQLGWGSPVSSGNGVRGLQAVLPSVGRGPLCVRGMAFAGPGGFWQEVRPWEAPGSVCTWSALTDCMGQGHGGRVTCSSKNSTWEGVWEAGGRWARGTSRRQGARAGGCLQEPSSPVSGWGASGHPGCMESGSYRLIWDLRLG